MPHRKATHFVWLACTLLYRFFLGSWRNPSKDVTRVIGQKVKHKSWSGFPEIITFDSEKDDKLQKKKILSEKKNEFLVCF